MEPKAVMAATGESVPPSFGQSVVCPVLIGRAAALASIQRLVDQVAEGRGGVALVSGEAGIGKSRLVAEARAYAEQRGLLVLAGASFPQDRACPYAPLLDLLRARFTGIDREEVAATVGPFARDLYPLLPDLVPYPADAAWMPPVDPVQDRRRLFAALTHCLAGSTPRQPVLVILEDLHWCDDGSLDFLLYLARGAVRRPLLLLGTYRAEDAATRLRDWLAELDRERLVEEVALTPLSREHVAEMLAAICGERHPAPAELLDTVYSLADGNPFLVEELLKALVSSGDVVLTRQGWEWSARPEASRRVPRSLQAAVQQRVGQLSSAAREVLTLAAVVGRRFDFELLQHLAHVEERTLLSLIKELIGAQLVVEESGEQFAFRHALTRQAIYADLLVRERVALHRMVAETAEQLWCEAPDHCLGDLAYHFAEAGVWDRALTYARRAGERAQRLYAPRTAVEHLSRALDAAAHQEQVRGPESSPVPAATVAGMRRERGRAYERLGDFGPALADYEAALRLARSAGDRRLEWLGLLDLGMLWAGRDYERAGDCYQRALDLARALDDPAMIAESLNRVGNWRSNAEQPRDALPLHREALAIFERLDDRRGIATTLDLLGMASYLSADLRSSMAYYERAVPLLRELDDRPALASSLAMLTARGGSYELGSMTSEAADFAAGLRYGEQALELARAIDWRAGEAFALLNMATVLGPLGEFSRALTLAQRGLRVAEEIEHLQWMVAGHSALGHIYLDLLAFQTARRHFERALDLSREIRSSFWVQQCTGGLAYIYAQQRELGRAAALLGPTPDVETPVASLGERWMVYGHVYLALARREPALALRLLGRSNALALDGTGPRDTPRPALARATALTALERWDEARRILEPLQGVLKRQGTRPLLWRCRVALGDVYRAEQRSDEAQRVYVAARAVIEELAAGLTDETLREEFLRNATALLPRPYRLSPSRVESARSGGLTAREREVVTLIVQGHSNREIAETLVLGERTIETHVSNVLNKLGLSSRREIARWAQERGLTAERL